MRKETLTQCIEKIAKEMGFSGLEEFINKWIGDGGTFNSLQEWLLLEKGLKFHTSVVYRGMKKYLTIPYEPNKTIWYKWDSVAKVKGFKNFRHMIMVYRRRGYTQEKMAEELGVIRRCVVALLRRMKDDKKREGEKK